jgi:hypothetical protein
MKKGVLSLLFLPTGITGMTPMVLLKPGKPEMSVLVFFPKHSETYG